MKNYKVKASNQGTKLWEFQIKLSNVSSLIFPITSVSSQTSQWGLNGGLPGDHNDPVLCTNSLATTPKCHQAIYAKKCSKKKEVEKIILSPFTATSKYSNFLNHPM